MTDLLVRFIFIKSFYCTSLMRHFFQKYSKDILLYCQNVHTMFTYSIGLIGEMKVCYWGNEDLLLAIR